MKAKQIFIYLFIGILLLSCTKEIPFESVYPQDEVVVNCLFAEDSIWYIHLSWSRSILDNDYYNFDPIERSEITLKDEFGAQAEFIELGDGWYGSKELAPQREVEYSLEVEVPDRETLRAKDILPSKSFIESIEHNSKNNFTESEILFNLEFQDEIGQDFYYVEVLYQGQFSGRPNPYDIIALSGNYQAVYPELFDQDYFYGRIYLTDEGVDGEKQRLDFIISQYFEDGEILIRLVHASRNAYLYNYSSEVQGISEGNPFAQPAIIHNNIENGFGIFGGVCIDEKRFKIGP